MNSERVCWTRRMKLVPKAGLANEGLLRCGTSRQSSLALLQSYFLHSPFFAAVCLQSALFSSLSNTYATLDGSLWIGCYG